MSARFISAACVLGTAIAGAASAAPPDCGDLLWKARAPSTAPRALTPVDLVRLRDVGPANDELSGTGRHIFTLSPDGRHVAFQIRRADPATNTYCMGMVVLDWEEKGLPRIVDRGGEFLQYNARLDGQPGRDTGIAMVITPQWSSDGRWIAFLKRQGGAIQLWRAWTDGSGSAPILAVDQDVVSFQVIDAHHIRVRLQNRLDQDVGATEALRGYHYDARFFPASQSTPLLVRPGSARTMDLDLDSGRLLPAPSGSPSVPLSATDSPATSVHGDEVEPIRLGSNVPETRVLQVTDHLGGVSTCSIEVCGKLVGPIWWRPDGRAVRFLQWSGWGSSEMRIAEWRPGSSRARILYATEDRLIDCQPLASGKLMCLRETATKPRHLVAIDLAHHGVNIVADFNLEYAALTLGRVRRLRLQSNAGIKTFADLVYPVGYQRGRRYPLLVVQYRSRGFLRGGVGDEFPIQAYANQGYAVLSVERPDPVGVLARPADYVEVDRLGLRDFADRWNVLSVVEQGVRQVIAEGVADPEAVGITGLSDGVSTVQFAAINSHLFAAGAVADCCWESDQDALLGPAAQTLYRRVGWPGIIDPSPDFWSHISLIQNARRVAFPILFDQPDDEYRVGLSSYVALREANQPADLFVFPDEHHIKWQPAHRLAAYQRSIDWFNFWLRDQRPTDPIRRAEVDRWQAMKEEARSH